jgi:hypothetical protein
VPARSLIALLCVFKSRPRPRPSLEVRTLPQNTNTEQDDSSFISNDPPQQNHGYICVAQKRQRQIPIRMKLSSARAQLARSHPNSIASEESKKYEESTPFEGYVPVPP